MARRNSAGIRAPRRVAGAGDRHEDRGVDAVQLLRLLNIDIGEAEARGASEYLEELLAPAFAMRRADGERIDDRQRFIASVAESAGRATTVDSITLFGANRALAVAR